MSPKLQIGWVEFPLTSKFADGLVCPIETNPVWSRLITVLVPVPSLVSIINLVFSVLLASFCAAGRVDLSAVPRQAAA